MKVKVGVIVILCGDFSFGSCRRRRGNIKE